MARRPSSANPNANGSGAQRHEKIATVTNHVRDAGRRQRLIVFRDAGILFLLGLIVLVANRTVGIVCLIGAALITALFLAVLASTPGRLEKALSTNTASQAVILRESRRRGIGRLWLTSGPNRSVIAPLPSADADTIADDLVSLIGHGTVQVHDDEKTARAAFTELTKRRV